MGVTGLWKLIETCGSPVPVENLESKILAVDISIWLHQVVKGFHDKKGITLPNAHLIGLFHRLCKLLYYRIKPIFVFDGCVPQLKRETIARRQLHRNKLNNEVERLQALLLRALAKEKVVQQALGEDADLLSKSPNKRGTASSNQNDRTNYELFKLPENPEKGNENDDDLDKYSQSNDNSYEDNAEFTFLGSSRGSSFTTEDSSFEESDLRKYYYSNLQNIDVRSEQFKALPADVRREILIDIKETRKQSSWGRLHDLPKRIDDFCTFQMGRLLNRRAVQESIEHTEQEMSDSLLTYNDLQRIFCEEGIVGLSSIENDTKRICSDENTRYLLIRDLKKKSEKQEHKYHVHRKDKQLKLNTNRRSSEGNDDSDLELAIALSLEEYKNNINLEEKTIQSNQPIDHGDEHHNGSGQRKNNCKAAIAEIISAPVCKSPVTASHDEVFEEVSEKNEKNISVAVDLAQKYKPEDDLFGDIFSNKINETKSLPTTESNKKAQNCESLETTSDDDVFEEVPDEVENKNIAITIDIAHELKQEDDLFGDIFSNKIDEIKFLPTTETNKKAQNCESLETTSDDDIFEEVPDKVENRNTAITIDIPHELKPEDDLFSDIFSNKIDETKSLPAKEANIKAALEELKNQANSINDIKLEDIKINPSIQLSHNDDDDDVEFFDAKINKSPNSTEISQIALETIILSDDHLNRNELLKSAHSKAPIRGEISDYFQTEYKIKRTPEKENKDNISDLKLSPSVNRNPQKAAKRSLEFNSASNTPSPKISKNKPNEIFCSEKSPVVDVVSAKQNALDQAASLLKENKTVDELKDLALQISEERTNLESERNRQDRMGTSISQRMNSDCQELLRLFGIPYIVAPMEAEAQCAFLDAMDLTNGTITDDSDIWLFGGRTVYKNFFAQDKHVLEFKAEQIEKHFNCDRIRLIQLACLVGSDYTKGVHGIGTVTGLEILASFAASSSFKIERKSKSKEKVDSSITEIAATLRRFRDWWEGYKSTSNPIRASLRKKLRNIELHEGFPNNAVIEAYLKPKVDENKEAFTWGYPNLESIHDFTKKYFGWDRSKTDNFLKPVIRRINEKKTQTSIKKYFSIKSSISPRPLKISKRVQTAINKLTNKLEAESEIPKINAKRIIKRKVATRKQKK